MWAPTLDVEGLLRNAPSCLALWFITFAPVGFLLVATPKSSLLRWLWLPCYVFSAHQLSISLFNASAYAGFRVSVAALSVNALTVAFLTLTVQRPGHDDLAQAGVFHKDDRLPVKVAKTMARFYNFRVIGTKWQINKVASHPKYLEARRGADGKIPRGTYLLRQTLILAWQYLLIDLVYAMSVAQPKEEMDAMVGSEAEFRYVNLTPEEWQGRISIGLMGWLGPSRVVIDIFLRTASIVLVGLGVSDPEAWPPVIRSLADMYTIRGFWGTYWHQWLRWPFTTTSNFITRRVLRLPTPSLIERYLNVFLVFSTSGFLHVVIDYYDPACASYIGPTMAFFCSFTVGVIIEDAVQAIWRSVSGAGARKEDADVPIWQKLVGYAWVAAWLTMTTPWYLYPKLRQPPEMSAFVPVLISPHIGTSAVGGLLAVGAPILLFGFGGEL